MFIDVDKSTRCGKSNVQLQKIGRCSDSWSQVSDSTRIESGFLVNWTQLETRFSQNDSTGLESQSLTRVRVVFTKCVSL